MKQILIWYQSEFDIFVTLSNSLIHNEQTNIKQEFVLSSFQAFIMPVLHSHCQAIFPHFGKFSKRLSDFKHSYLSQMITKN